MKAACLCEVDPAMRLEKPSVDLTPCGACTYFDLAIIVTIVEVWEQGFSVVLGEELPC